MVHIVEDALIISGDTIIVFKNKILGKPRDPDEARRMLRELRGRWHRVISSVTVCNSNTLECRSAIDVAYVKMRYYSGRELEEYLETGEPLNVAGAYRIQGAGFKLVEMVIGDLTTIIGLPVKATLRLLRSMGAVFNF